MRNHSGLHRNALIVVLAATVLGWANSRPEVSAAFEGSGKPTADQIARVLSTEPGDAPAVSASPAFIDPPSETPETPPEAPATPSGSVEPEIPATTRDPGARSADAPSNVAIEIPEVPETSDSSLTDPKAVDLTGLDADATERFAPITDFDARAATTALLTSDRLRMDGAVRGDLASGRTSPEIVRMLTLLTRNFTLSLGVLSTGHSLCIDGTSTPGCPGSSISMHPSGRAVDVFAVNGEPVSTGSGHAWMLVEYLLGMADDVRPNEIGLPWKELEPLPGVFSDARHQRHLHLGFDPGLGTTSDGRAVTVPASMACLASDGDARPTPDVVVVDARSGMSSLRIGAVNPERCGSLSGAAPRAILLSPECRGAWVLGVDGSIRSVGDAAHHGDLTGSSGTGEPVALIGVFGGYRIVSDDGRVSSFGNAGALGDLGGVTLVAPIIDAASTPTGSGYWLLGADGAVFSFGDAIYQGGAADILAAAAGGQRAVAIASTPSGDGYWILASDGGVFTFGDAPMWGSLLGLPTPEPGTEGAGHAQIPIAWLPDETAIDIVRTRSGYVVVTSRRRLTVFLAGNGGPEPFVESYRIDSEATAADSVGAAACSPLAM